jgi:LPS export ABC transporter protein LptC
MPFRIFTLLAVVALAISTWILSSPAHRPKPTSAVGGAALPGYYLKNTVLTDYDATGAASIRIEAERIDQIDHSAEVELSNVRVDYQAPNGQNWMMFGDTAHVQPGGKVVDVAGNVRLQGEATGRSSVPVVRTDSLSFDVADSIATSKSDVRLEFGPHSLAGRGLVANLKERTLRLESKVHGHFQP